MKIICDCGAESKFEFDLELNNQFAEDEYYQDKKVDIFSRIHGDIFIKDDHDGLYFTCEKCGKRIYCLGAQYGNRKRRII